jgi:hypothetical protein
VAVARGLLRRRVELAGPHQAGQALSYLETGDRKPTWETVQLLAKALGLDCRAFEDAALALPEYKPGRPGPKPKGKPKK